MNKRGLLVTSFLVILLRELNTEKALAMQMHGAGFLFASLPGAPDVCNNLFDLCQILAWLAKERRDIQERLEWQEGIPDLMTQIAN